MPLILSAPELLSAPGVRVMAGELLAGWVGLRGEEGTSEMGAEHASKGRAFARAVMYLQWESEEDTTPGLIVGERGRDKDRKYRGRWTGKRAHAHTAISRKKEKLTWSEREMEAHRGGFTCPRSHSVEN